MGSTFTSELVRSLLEDFDLAELSDKSEAVKELSDLLGITSDEAEQLRSVLFSLKLQDLEGVK